MNNDLFSPEEDELEDKPEGTSGKKKSWEKPAQVIPVYGMKGTFGKANPDHSNREPKNSELPTMDDIRTRFIQGGLDSHELIIEMKRLVRIGAIPMDPKSIKAIIDAEMSLAETTVRLADTEGKVKGLKPLDDRNVVLQILNQTYNLMGNIYQGERERRDMIHDKETVVDAEFEPAPESEPVSGEHLETVQKFRQLKK